MEKIVYETKIKKIAEKLRRQGKIIVTTNGSFDILHYAHVDLLEKARKEGDVLIVLLNSDSSIKRNKGPTRPIIGQNERAKMLAALKAVSYVVIFEDDKPLKLLEIIKPHKHVKGGSFIEERIIEEKNLLDKWGGKFVNFELIEGFSTTNLINKILNNYDEHREKNA